MAKNSLFFFENPPTVRVSPDRNSRSDSMQKNSVSFMRVMAEKDFFAGNINIQINWSCPEELEMYMLLYPRMQRSWNRMDGFKFFSCLFYFFNPFIGCLSADTIAPHNFYYFFSGQILFCISLDAQLWKLYTTFELSSFGFPWKAGVEAPAT